MRFRLCLGHSPRKEAANVNLLSKQRHPRSSGATTEYVWDAFVRVFHWILVVAFLVAYLSEGEPMALHIWSGYLVLTLVVLRIVWGFIGSPHARFADFVFSPRAVIRHLSDELRFRAKRYVGHSPAGGAMVIALMVMLLATTTSGLALYALQPDQGVTSHAVEPQQTPDNAEVEVWEEVHEIAANMTLLLVILHVGGVILASLAQRENLVKAMFNGRKSISDRGHGDA